MRLSVLHRKLGRDLWRIRAQGADIAVVVGIGVMVLVMMSRLITTLSCTRDRYFQDYRFASVFAHVTRAPQAMVSRLAEIDGVLAAEGRISGAVRIDLPGESLPIAARVLSLPSDSPARMNDIVLTVGRLPAPGQSGEVLLVDSFAVARGIAVTTLSTSRLKADVSGSVS